MTFACRKVLQGVDMDIVQGVNFEVLLCSPPVARSVSINAELLQARQTRDLFFTKHARTTSHFASAHALLCG